jgi:hypothetical protein
MGSLKPNVRYIYERQGGVVYAREFGADPSTRQEIGYDWEYDTNPSRTKGTTREQILENQMWHEIRRAAETNPALQNVLDQAIMLYKLGKDYE